MTIELLKAGLAVLFLVALWVGVEALWRKAMPARAAQKDGLAGHGCGTCADKDSCQVRPVHPATPTPMPTSADAGPPLPSST